MSISDSDCTNVAVSCPKTGQVTTASSELPHWQDVSNLAVFNCSHVGMDMNTGTVTVADMSEAINIAEGQCNDKQHPILSSTPKPP